MNAISALAVCRPVNAPITQVWGNRAYGPNGYGGHPGTDYGCPNGTPILAPFSGEVLYAGYADGFGYHCVCIYSPALGVSCTLGHGQANYVVTGQQVTMGQHVADVDTQGFATGPHLHLEIRPGRQAFGANPPNIDPEAWLQLHLNTPFIPALTAADRTAIKRMQEIIGVTQDGVWGKQTNDRMQTLRWKLLTPPNKAVVSSVVKLLQHDIYHFGAADNDGIWGPKTDAAMRLSQLCWLNK